MPQDVWRTAGKTVGFLSTVNSCMQILEVTQASGPKYRSTTTSNFISFVVTEVYLNDHVVSIQQDTSSLESLEQRRDNLSAFRLVEVDDLVANLCDICKRDVRDGGDLKNKSRRTLASKPKLLVYLLVWA